jgi:hypothetical protein
VVAGNRRSNADTRPAWSDRPEEPGKATTPPWPRA